MTTKVIMPQMGESIIEGTITKWLKKVGDQVVRDEPLFEISTDKVDSEIPSPAAGILTQILVPEGQTVQINTVVAVIDGERAEGKERIEAARVLEPVPEEEATPKADEKPSPPARLGPAVDLTSAKAPLPGVRSPLELRASPLVRRLAREHNVDLSRIQGTGLGGRISKHDILSFIDHHAEAPPRPAPAQPTAIPTPETPKPVAEVPKLAGETETVPMTPMRKAIAERMILSRRTSAHVSTVFEVDVNAIVQLRERHKASFEAREGIKLTYTPFFVKALVDGVREFPVLNCSVSGDNIIYKRAINVGIAVALETGLIVPVVRDAHLKSFTGLALSIHSLAERARTKKLKPEDVQNGTITITNPGIYGPLFGTPIINQPQVAILGVGGIEKRPIVIHDAIAIRSMVYLSLSFDHRVIDGAVADQFMARLKSKLQTWTEWVD